MMVNIYQNNGKHLFVGQYFLSFASLVTVTLLLERAPHQLVSCDKALINYAKIFSL